MITIALIAYQRQRSMKNGNQPIRSAATKNRFGASRCTIKKRAVLGEGTLKCWSDDSGRQSYASMCVCAFLKAIRGKIPRTKKKRLQNSLNSAGARKARAFGWWSGAEDISPLISDLNLSARKVSGWLPVLLLSRGIRRRVEDRWDRSFPGCTV